jgi:hypothetical protein
MFKSERHFALSDSFPSDLLSSGAMEPHEPRRKPSRAWLYAVLLIVAVIATAVLITLTRH